MTTPVPPVPPKTPVRDEDEKYKKKFQELKERYDALKTERDALWAENEAMRDTLQRIHSLSLPTPHFTPAQPTNSSSDGKSRKDKKAGQHRSQTEASLSTVDLGIGSAPQLPLAASTSSGTVSSRKGAQLTTIAATSASLKSSGSTGPAAPAPAKPKQDPFALHNAILNEGSLEVVQKLIDEGQDINYRDKNNWTPLHCCASVGQLEICEALLKKDTITVTGIFALNNDGNGALHYLVRHSPAEPTLYLRVLNMITDKGADPNLKNRSGETPLHAACFRGNTIALEFLLSKGANPNTQNNKGETPLHYAVRAGAKNLVTELLRFGADPKIAGDNLQGTPLDIAQKQGMAEIVTLLKDPKYALIPMTLHSIGMEKHVPLFVALNLEPAAFRNLGEAELSKLTALSEDERKKILAKLTKMKESPELNLEELEWEATWDDVIPEKEIGRGHYGVVFRGKWKGREVAIKQLKNPKPELVEEFLGEVEVMKHVRLHENVVNLLGVVKTPHIAIISEFLPMGSLDRLLPTMELDPELIVRLARGTAAGMAFLHAQNIVHRDLACRNLLATKNARQELTIKITDFGMSRFNKADGPQSEAQQQSGPLKWMAPEALNYEYVKKTDVWSFGVTLVEILLKGGDPYPGKTPMEVALFVRDENGMPNVPPDTPPELEAIMKDCWKYSPEDRASFEQLVTKLDQYHFKLKRHAPNMKPLGDGKNIVVSDSVEVGFKVGGDKKTIKKKPS